MVYTQSTWLSQQILDTVEAADGSLTSAAGLSHGAEA